MKPKWILAFSGYRPSHQPGRSLEEISACREEISTCMSQIRSMAQAEGSEIELFTSCAAGADIEAIEVAESLGIPVHLILPQALEHFETDFQDFPEEWQRAEPLIRKASNSEEGWTLRIVQGDKVRPDCYHETNLQILSSADALLAVCKEGDECNFGSTTEMIREAVRRKLPVTRIDPSPGLPKRVSSQGWEEWPPKDALFKELSEALQSHPRGKALIGDKATARAIFEVLDNLATSIGINFRKRLLASLYLHFAAALLAAFTASFAALLYKQSSGKDGLLEIFLYSLPKIFTSIEFVLVTIAWYLMWRASKAHSHNLWLNTRFAAELLRSRLFCGRTVDPLNPALIRSVKQWQPYFLSSSLHAYHSTPSEDFSKRKEIYLKERVIHQIQHFTNTGMGASSQRQFWSKVATLATISAPIVIGVALSLKLVFPDLIKYTYWGAFIVVFLPIALPLTAGAATSLIGAKDAARRSERYEMLKDRLIDIEARIEGAQTEGAFRDLVFETEELLSSELIEWYTAAKSVGH